MIGPQPDGATVIAYPALTPLLLIDEVAGDPAGELLGHTRATVLRLTCRERTTTQLASELGVSAATVSGTHEDAAESWPDRHHPRRESGAAFAHPLGGRLLEGATPAGPGTVGS